MSFTVSVTAGSLCALTRQYVAEPAIGDALCVKIRNGAAAAARGDRTGANAELVNYQNQVTAQTGKALSPQQAGTLTNLAGALAAGW